MAFKPLTEAETNALAAFETARDLSDRRALMSLAAQRDIAQIDEAASVLLSAPDYLALPPADRAVVEAIFAVPRTQALTDITDASEAIEQAQAVMAETRPIFDGGADG